MTNRKSKARKFNGMNYREVQRANSGSRNKLRKEDKQWLKDNHYKNAGWENIIRLYEKLKEFLDQYQLEDLTLEELFLEVDQIGNKYLTSQEVEEFNQKLSQAVSEVAEEIDKQFPDTETEIVDFSAETGKTSQKNQKSYKTIKLS